jgi:hypothetical protein
MHTIFPSDRLRKLRYGCTIGSFWAACAIWLICSRVWAPAGTVWLLMNLGIVFDGRRSPLPVSGKTGKISNLESGCALAQLSQASRRRVGAVTRDCRTLDFCCRAPHPALRGGSALKERISRRAHALTIR